MSRRSGIALLLLAIGAALVGCGAPAGAPARVTPVTHPVAPAQRGLPRSVPTWVDIPSIGARSRLVALGLNPDRSVQVPPVSRPLQAGWYEYGPAPGQIGPSVILGHIDGDHQEGIFWRLHEVKPGDQVTVGRQDGRTVTFVVRTVDEVAKSAFPTSAVYGNTNDAELRLITCGGVFDAGTRNYLDNVIVYATMTG